MAESTEFDHDQLGHILADYLLEVPVFQRAFSWDPVNVQEYLSDLERARKKKSEYFMGTIVFAKPDDDSERRKIVDGQQRLVTTALLIAAIRDQLRLIKKDELADNTDKKYLRRYSIQEEVEVDSLLVSPADQDAYDAVLAGYSENLAEGNRIRVAYEVCVDYVKGISPTQRQYKRLVELISQLEDSVQVLVAVASNLPEAYVIFETLNDRGADLTTSDLLKNFLFSESRKSEFSYVQHGWETIEANFGNKPEMMVKFVRHEYMSRHGRVTTRGLYRAVQDDLHNGLSAKGYVKRLKEAHQVYMALRDVDHEYWKNSKADVRDALNAYRRFGFESSYPVLLAAFREWDRNRATRLLVKVAKWSVRAQFVGRLGTGTAEEAFASTAAAISDGTASNQPDVKSRMSKLVPTDSEFRIAFMSSGKLTVNRAKYILAMLEKAADAKAGRAERALDWTSPAVTIEHVLPLSSANGDEEKQVKIDEIGNLALLEKRLNHQLGNKAFPAKRDVYRQSDFRLTTDLSNEKVWDSDTITKRTADLADLACAAWPSS